MEKNILLSIGNQYFRSISLTEKKETTVEPLSEKEKAEVIFTDILPASNMLDKKVLATYGQVLSKAGIKDLRLLEGGKNSATQSVLNKIDHTQTSIGKCIKATMLASPTNKIETIQKRKASIKELQNKSIANKVDNVLTTYKEKEANLLSYYTTKDPLKQPVYKKKLDGFYFKRFGLKQFNQSTIALQLGKWWKDYWLHIGFGGYFIWAIVWLCIYGLSYPIGYEKVSNTTIWGRHTIFQFFWNFMAKAMVLPGINIYNSFDFYKSVWQGTSEYSAGIIQFFLTLEIIFTLVGIYFVYRAIKKYQENRDTLQYLAKRLISFQCFVKTLENLVSLTEKEKALATFSEEYLASASQLLNAPIESEVGALVNNLKTLSLDNWSYFLSPQGKLLATYQLLEKHKYRLADALYELGQLDALRSGAILLAKAEQYSPENHYVFTDFVTESASPMMEQENMWHPSLDAKRVVTNSVVLQQEEHGTRMIVLTGPNAGGKSTYLQTMTLNLVLSQVFGFASCKRNKQTIFHKLITYFDIVQDLSEGLSFFEAKVQGLEILMKTLATLPAGQFAFCMLDEPLSGTAEKIAEEAGYEVMEHLYKENPHALFIVVTHLAKLTELATHQGCENKKVYVEMDGDKVHYTYKIKEGKADQNVALHILKKRGLIRQ